MVKTKQSALAQKASKGFTLIELLVVIAIIGLLAAVVLASLSGARNKGKDAAVEEELANLRSSMEIYASSNNGSYQTGASAVSTCNAASTAFVDTTSGTKALLDKITKDLGGTTYSGMTCGIAANGGAWAVSAKLPGAGTYQCVDSSGQSKNNGSTAYAAGATAC